ncbi:MAG TPA: FecR domain-containing protein [Trichocoleus sp.]
MVNQKLLKLVSLPLLASSLLPLSPAQADVALTRADVNAILNRVELLPRGRSARPARLSDYLGLGDALRTAAASRAELRFNDGSLARVGERATFRFTPNTRNFRLSNGTVLLLIPPGQGRTTIQTPNAVTGIQGSGLVVRYIPGQDLTLVMALTNNPAGPMTVTTQDGAQSSALYAGQMALVQPSGIEVVEFDLNGFYQTSDLIEGLGLSDENVESSTDDPLHAVRQETLEALSQQPPFSLQNAVLPAGLISTDMAGGNRPAGNSADVSAESNQPPSAASDGSRASATNLDRYTELPPGLVIPAGENAAVVVGTQGASSGVTGVAPTTVTPVTGANPAVGVTPTAGTETPPGQPDVANPIGSPVGNPPVAGACNPGGVIPATPANPGEPGGGATPAIPATPC